jgi:transcriptional regulator with XRE-family HTH domain
MPLIVKKNRLREKRRELGFSGYDVQLLSGIGAQRIYFIERGLTHPNKSERARLAAALKVPEEEVFPPKMRFNLKVE